MAIFYIRLLNYHHRRSLKIPLVSCATLPSFFFIILIFTIQQNCVFSFIGKVN